MSTPRYHVLLRASARRELAALPRDGQKRVIRGVDALAFQPRPPGSKPLSGRRLLWRIRVGDYRIIYEIRDGELIVLVIRVGHRRDAYRRVRGG